MKSVLATRPEEQNLSWCQRIENAGFWALPLPLLAIEGLRDRADIERAKRTLLQLDRFDKVIFVSQNAVNQAFNYIDDLWPQLPVGISFLAVGSATSECLQARCEQISPTAPAPHSAMNSESLLSLDELQSVEQQKILVVRGMGGRTKIAEELSRRGAEIHHCELYHRVLPATASSEFRTLTQQQIPDCISVFSGETLQNYLSIVKENDDILSTWRDLPVLVPGKRVAQLAKENTIKNIIQAENASERVMLEALHAWQASSSS